MTMPKFHIIRVFGTASISLVGFAHTRSFQDGDQKHGKIKSNRILPFCRVFTVDLTVLKHLPIQIPVNNLHNGKWKRQKIIYIPSQRVVTLFW